MEPVAADVEYLPSPIGRWAVSTRVAALGAAVASVVGSSFACDPTRDVADEPDEPQAAATTARTTRSSESRTRMDRNLRPRACGEAEYVSG